MNIGVGEGAVVSRAQQAVLDCNGMPDHDLPIIQAAIDGALADAAASGEISPAVQAAIDSQKAEFEAKVAGLEAQIAEHKAQEEEVFKLKARLEKAISEATQELQDQVKALQEQLAALGTSGTVPATGIGGTVTPAAALNAAESDQAAVDPSAQK